MTEPNPVVLPITPCAESKLPALTSKEYKKVSKNLQIIIYENTLVAAAGVEPATFAL